MQYLKVTVLNWIESQEFPVVTETSGVESAGACTHNQAMFIGIALVGLSEDCLSRRPSVLNELAQRRLKRWRYGSANGDQVTQLRGQITQEEDW